MCFYFWISFSFRLLLQQNDIWRSCHWLVFSVFDVWLNVLIKIILGCSPAFIFSTVCAFTFNQPNTFVAIPKFTCCILVCTDKISRDVAEWRNSFRAERTGMFIMQFIEGKLICNYFANQINHSSFPFVGMCCFSSSYVIVNRMSLAVSFGCWSDKQAI